MEEKQAPINEINARYVLDMHEARLERIINMLVKVIIFSWIVTILTNLGWAVYECQYSTELVTIEAQQESDNDSSNYIIGGNYGDKAESEDN